MKIIVTICGVVFLTHVVLSQEWQTVGDIYSANPMGGITVTDLEASGDSLLIGGFFDQVGFNGDTLNVRGVLVWDSLSYWGLYGDPSEAIMVFDNSLYIGGGLGIELTDDAIAGHNGQEWFSLQGGGSPSTSHVHDLIVYQGKLFACGSFDSMGTLDNSGIGAWNGTEWVDVGEIIGAGPPRCLEIFQGDLYVGGDHNQCYPPQIACPTLARYDGNEWHDTNGGATGAIWAMEADTANDLLYVGGVLTNVGGGEIWLESVAAWDGENWQQVADIGFNSNVSSMAVYRDQLYVGGTFTGLSDDTEMSFISRFDGVNWQSLDGGANNAVVSLEVYKDELYAGGSFDQIGGIEAHGVARYYLHPDSVTWGVPDTTINVLEHVADLGESFNVFPNPSTGTFQLEFQTYTDSPVVVTDMQGRQIYFDNSGWRDALSMDLSEEPPGTYLVNILHMSRLVSTKRIMIL